MSHVFAWLYRRCVEQEKERDKKHNKIQLTSIEEEGEEEEKMDAPLRHKIRNHTADEHRQEGVWCGCPGASVYCSSGQKNIKKKEHRYCATVLFPVASTLA